MDEHELDKIQKEILAADRVLCRKYRAVFGTDDGEDVLADLIDKCGIFAVITGLCPKEDRDFHDGRRSIGLEVLTVLGIEDVNKMTHKLLEVHPSENAVEEQITALNQEET